ncbi:M36 family metallopeptidase [Limnoglobus roseus]|uniref:Fungalysin metallopeptidase n=1 Tax=Limnoglobus roseus TaxID=2598579 RepID=A0A5C1AQL0_9BACT|nr:M36 family metallopeptidase [Limnoglobus roseus]QEL19474.1 fungalysin metallopeptidase [Limnoglobus roseus]
MSNASRSPKKSRPAKAVRRSHPLFVLSLEDRTVPTATVTEALVQGEGGLNTMPPSYTFMPSTAFASARIGNAETIARDTLSLVAAQAGLTPDDVASASVTDNYASLGESHVYFFQQLNGLPILNATAGVHLTANGQPVIVNAAFVPNLAAVAPAVVPPVVSATDAVPLAAAAFGYTLTTPPTIVATEGGIEQAVVVREKDFSDLDIRVARAYVNTPRGVRPVWEMSARTPDGNHWYQLTVDTQDGAVEYWADWVDNFDTYNVVPVPNDSPQDGGRAVLVNPADPVASPYGWHDTNGVAGAEFTDTRGNNVSAQDDLDANDSGGVRPSGGSGLIFDFPFPATQDPSTYLPALTTNLFYMNNVMHDVTYRYGFDEASGNFQTKNYTGLGKGNDAVLADAQDGSGTNNANFASPPDGSPPRMQMYRFTNSNPNRDSDFDNGVIAHEYGHGISNRLTGGPANASALNNLQSAGMGEGWSDFFALMLTQRTTDRANDKYGLATYVLGQPTTGDGIRQHPYSFDKTINPMTFSDYGTGTNQSTEVHWAGALWASALWDMNWLFINKYGFDPDLSTGYAADGGPASAGNKLALRLVLDGMKLQAVNPTFVQARDAILAADVALTGGVNQREIWQAFARRGLGASASTANSTSTSFNEAFDLPAASATPAVVAQSPAGVTAAAPASLTLTFSEAMDTSSFASAADVVSFTDPTGSDLRSSITGFAWTSATTLRIDFTAQSAQGLYTMVVGPNVTAADNGAAMNQDFDATPGEAISDRYTANFLYDPVALTVTAITPAAGATLTPNVTAVDVTFSEPVLASSLTVADLNLSQGTVTAVTLMSPTQVRFTVGGFGEGTTYLSLKYGAATDAAGFASLAFNSSFTLDYDTVAFPTPLTAALPLGSLVYDGTFPFATTVGTTADTDEFTITLDASQQLSAIVTPAAGATLIPRVRIEDPSGTIFTTFTGTTAGKAITASLPVAAAGTYKVRVSGNGTTTGAYSLRLLLNASGEGEQYGFGSNDTTGTAQALDPLAVAPTDSVAVTSIVGVAGATPAEVEANDTAATANDERNNFAAVPGSATYQLGWTGSIRASGDFDYVRVGTFQVGDVVTITMSGSASGITGGIVDPYVELIRANGTIVTEDDDSGPGTESILFRFAVVTPDTYYVRARDFGTGTGNYRIGVRLENAGTAPTTGGAFTAESEGNDSIGAANDASTSWQQVQNRAAVTGTISTAADADFFRYTLTANDRLTVRAVGDNGFAPTLALLNSAGTILQTVDGSTTEESGIYGFSIGTTGDYLIRVTSFSGTGTYTLEVLQSGTTLPAARAVGDFYSVSLTTGQRLSVGLTGSASTTLQILDPLGTVVVPAGTAAGSYTTTAELTAAMSGTYFVGVSDVYPTVYQLTVVSGATLDRGTNNATGTAQTLALGSRALGGLTSGPDTAWYAVAVGTAGPSLQFRTITPGDAAGEFVNTLDPIITVFDSSGTPVATDDNSAGDGRNALASVSLPTVGTYYVRVSAAGGSSGEYILATEQAGNTPPVASAGGSYTVIEGGSLSLSAMAGDAENDPLTYQWDLNNDGIFTDAAGPTPTLTAAQLNALGIGDGSSSGTAYPIRVRVSDGVNAPVVSADGTLTVINSAPTGTLANSGPTTESSATPTTVTVTATDPSAADVAAGLTYRFDFDNDGVYEVVQSANVATVPASLLADGPTTVTVHVLVTDKDGGTLTLSTPIVVAGVGPSGTVTGGTVLEGEAGNVSISGVSDPSSADTMAGFTYSYDFDNDGTFDLSGTTAAVIVPATFLSDGPFDRVVRVRISDKDNNFSEYTTTVHVTNANPTLSLADNGPVAEGSAFTLTATATDAPVDQLSLRYAFDFDNDGTFDLGGNNYATGVTGATASVPTADSGVRTVRVRVYDKDGGFTEAVRTVTVNNVAPTTVLSNGGPVAEGSAGGVSFGAVTDPSSADVAAGFTYSFDFDNDGTFDVVNVTTPTVVVPAAFLPNGPAVRTVRGRVTDKDGGFTDSTTDLTVTNVNPTATFVAGGSVAEGASGSVTFSSVVDPSPGDRAIVRYAFDFDNDGTFDVGDGTYAGSVTGASATVTASFLSDGPMNRVVRGRVIDPDGGFTDSTATIPVTNVAPTGTFTVSTPVPVGQPAVASFTAVADVPRDVAVGFRYEYDFIADGRTTTVASTSASASFTFASPGTYTVRGRVYDKDGGFTESTAITTVTTVAPTATFAGTSTIEGGAAIVAFAAVSHPSVRASAAGFRYSYDFDNDGVFDLGDGTYAGSVTDASVAVPASVIANSGDHTVRGRVIEVDGGFADRTATVRVLPVVTVLPPPVLVPPPPPPVVVPPPPVVIPPPPVVVPPAPRGFAVGADAGGQARAILFGGEKQILFDGVVFNTTFTGGVRVATGDVDGDGVPDLIVGTGPGTVTQVRVLSGVGGRELFSIQPFESAFTGGVYVAAGDIDGDGKAEIAISPDEGGGPRVRVFHGGSFSTVTDYFGIDDPNFRGGARPAFGDINGDGRADLLVAAGFGGGPRVSVWDGAFLGTPSQRTLFNDFFLFEQTLRNGVFITAGDLNGDGFEELIAGGGPGGGPRVFALDGKELIDNRQVVAANFFAGDPNNRGGVRVAAADVDGDGRADILAGTGPGTASHVTRYLGSKITASGQPPVDADDDYFPGLAGGVFVG